MTLSAILGVGCTSGYFVHQRAFHLLESGRYAEAIPIAREAVAIRERELDPTHPDLAMSRSNLALLLVYTGDYVGSAAA